VVDSYSLKINGMTKKSIVVLFLVLFSSQLFAQLSASASNKEDMQTFFKTKTYFVLTANKKLNEETMAGLKQYWKHTPYDTISEGNIGDKISNNAYSFLMVIKIEDIMEKRDVQTQRVISKTVDYYHYFGVINGGKKAIEHFVYTDMVAYCPINYLMDEKPMFMCGYRAQSMVYNLHTAIQLVKEKKLEGNSYKLAKQLQEIYNENSSAIKAKTLLVNKEHLKDLTEEDFKAAYTFKVEFCSKEKFEKAYVEKDKNYVIFQPTVTRSKSIWVIDAETYKCLYFGTDLLRLKMDKGDIKDLVKAIAKK